MSFDTDPADDDPHGECRHEIEQLQALLCRVYREVGNESSGFKRHALPPSLRDDIRDYLKTTGYFRRSPVCEIDCGDGSTVYDDRPRPSVPDEVAEHVRLTPREFACPKCRGTSSVERHGVRVCVRCLGDAEVRLMEAT